MKRLRYICVVGCLAAMLAPVASPQTANSDVVLKAMLDEMARSRQLRLMGLDAPYYFEYSLEDADTFSVAATLGALLGSAERHARVPQIQVRVGGYDFDNTDHIYSGYYSGSRYDPEQWPVENSYDALRHDLWLATDRSFKAALESIARKRGSLRNIASEEKLPDFAKAEPVTAILKIPPLRLDEQPWTTRVLKLSNIFSEYPEITLSGVDADLYQGTSYFVNSEGTEERSPDTLTQLRVQARTQAPDGMVIRDGATFQSLEANGMPSDLDLQRGITSVAENVKALMRAPVGESYSGPVLFEGTAAAQLFAQLLGDNFRVPRRPVSDPGRQISFMPSEFEGRVGSRVLPEWMDVVDDPTQTEWHGHQLAGHYLFDMEGVRPQPVLLVEKGVLKNYLMTRQPIKGFSGSNGHARLPGSFGARSATIGNLFIKATTTKPDADLKKQLIDMCKQRNKPYGMLVRKLDYPSSASIPEIQAIAASFMQSGGGARPVSPPVLVYRVYPDGREELVRGLRFRALSARSLRDIIAASDESYLFEFINNGAAFALMGAPGYLAPTSVVSPAVLFEDLEFEHPQEELSKPPVVPPPPMETTRGS